jgi:signal transduction histidine kinase
MARAGGADVAMELAPDLLVSADPDDVRRILANLLDNAARYGGSGVRIRLTTSGSERDAILEVIDDGPGIAATDLDRIFEPFFRVNQDAASPDGTGLGLPLARSLADRSGGRLTVDSEPGVGSRFRLTLPRFR